jgi:hypothetical protein
MANYKLKQLGIMSVAKIGAIMGLIFGIIQGIFMALIIGSMGIIAKNLVPMAGLGAGVIFILCIIGGLIWGFIGGAIAAFVYNAAAGFVGPIEMELES